MKRSGDYEYIFREGAIAFPDPLDKPARTMLTSEGSMQRSTHIIKPGRNYRILTPVETERINGFPDDWTNTGMPERSRYFCMGNALVVYLIEKMGHRLNNIFRKEKELYFDYEELSNIKLSSLLSLYSVLETGEKVKNKHLRKAA